MKNVRLQFRKSAYVKVPVEYMHEYDVIRYKIMNEVRNPLRSLALIVLSHKEKKS